MKKLVILFLFIVTSSFAKDLCTGKLNNPVTDICWDCIFPVSIGAIEIPKSTMARPDTKNPSSPICVCPGKLAGLPLPGLAIGFWEPIRMVDVTKRPFCMVNMGGKSLKPSGFKFGGTQNHNNDDKSSSWNVHWYINPLVFIMNLIVDALCLEASSSFDLAYLSELDPLYNNDVLSFIINPEAILFANPIAHAACAADCIASSVKLPLDSLFWCSGCQGTLYPFTANNVGYVGTIQSTSLSVEKFIAKLHRQMQLMVTSGEAALCMPYPSPIVKKSQYRLQTTFPIPGQGKLGCSPFGRTTVHHEMLKEIPIAGEDFGYFVWRKRNCCLL
jgi:conjugal transfer pilus assembly protein TraU